MIAQVSYGTGDFERPFLTIKRSIEVGGAKETGIKKITINFVLLKMHQRFLLYNFMTYTEKFDIYYTDNTLIPNCK